MKTLVTLIVSLIIPLTSFAADSLENCNSADMTTIYEQTGGYDKVQFLDASLTLGAFVEKGQKAQEIPYGSKTFVEVLKTTDQYGAKLVCVRISGQAYFNGACDACAVLKD